MNDSSAFPWVAPKLQPVLDPGFRPAVLANRAFRAAAQHSALKLGIALEQSDGTVSHFRSVLLPETHPDANFHHAERLVKFLLWARGGYRIYLQAPGTLADRLARHFQDSAMGRFDSQIVGEKIYDHPLQVVRVDDLPVERVSAASLGRHLEGCRIGFDLGGSDRKVAAVKDGAVVFSEETTWDPYFQPNPQYHYDGIMDSLRKAAAHLPRVDAIGGSAAGVYVNNQVKVASLFRGVPADLFNLRVRNLFFEVRKAWNDVPLEVANDGEVTALAGSMALKRNRILGISLGTSTAAGYINKQGNITSWLNELAFVPVDYRPDAPADEWSGDRGCGVQYFSQQCVGRLLAPAGIEVDPKLPLPEKLKHVQELMRAGDPRALRIYQTIGTYLGYAVAHFAEFYDLEVILILGRVTSGPGGDVILAGAREVLRAEFPELADQIEFQIPDETQKRHGQAIAAASLPEIR